MDYNSRLKPMERKGKCGDQEFITSSAHLQLQVTELAEYLHRSKYSVVFTGAGISTAYPASIPDFRGPNGVWTRELQGNALSPEEKTPKLFNQAKPTFSHRAIFHLMQEGLIHHVISQNVDGLHLRSGIPMEKISEIHGNIFLEICEKCQRRYFRDYDVGGMGLKYTGNRCEVKTCQGKLRDFAIDWDTDLPEDIMEQAKNEVLKADLVICLGTSLRIRPAGNMPAMVLRPHKLRNNRRGKLVIVNLQETHLNDRAHLVIHHYADEVMKLLCQKLGLTIPVAVDEEAIQSVSRNRKATVSNGVRSSSAARIRKESDEEEEEREEDNDDIVITYDSRETGHSNSNSGSSSQSNSKSNSNSDNSKVEYYFHEEIDSPHQTQQHRKKKKPRITEEVNLLVEQCLSEAAKEDCDEDIQIVYSTLPSQSSNKKRDLGEEIAALLQQEIFVHRVKYLKYFLWQQATRDDHLEEAHCRQLYEEYEATAPIGDLFSQYQNGKTITFKRYCQQYQDQLGELQTRLVAYMQLTTTDSQRFPDYVQKLADKISLERHLKEMKEQL